MSTIQEGILAPLPGEARQLFFQLHPEADPRAEIAALAELCDGLTAVVGVGQGLTARLEGQVAGLRPFFQPSGNHVSLPSTPAALWVWLRGGDRGELIHRTRHLERALAASFWLESAVDTYLHRDSRDLTGYVDGTENPTGEAALNAAILSGQGRGLDGSSFVAVQQWEHDLAHFEQLPSQEQDHIIGRRRSDNEELEEAPESAHVKRTAQESFTPEAFVLRRSMPWSDARRAGLQFVAFGRSLEPFEAQLRRMVGDEDGIVDGLFRFSRPLTGAYFWCPPRADGRLDLSCLGL